VGDAPGDEFAALHGLYWLVANLAERGPLLVVVDDLQWADGPSLSWLVYLGRRVGELPVLVVLGVREGDPRVGRRLVRGVIGDPAVERVRLSPLSLRGVSAVVGAGLGGAPSGEFCAACYELTGGNPLYVRQLLAACVAEGVSGGAGGVEALRSLAPRAVGTSVLARLSGLGDDAVRLARSLAVLGSGTEVAAAAELAGLDSGRAELTADALAAAQIFAPVRPLEFFHPLIGEAVYADIAPGARRLEHRRAASIVEGAGGLDRVAAHLMLTGPRGDRWVVERLVAAAGAARERGAPEVAAGYLRRALEEPPDAAQRPALMLRLGRAEWRAGLPGATAHLEEALAGARDAATVAAAAGSLARAFSVADRTDVSVAVLRRAVARVTETDSSLALTLEASCALVGVMDDRTAPAALDAVEALRGRIGEIPDPPVNLLVVVANVALRGRRATDARRLIDRVLSRKPYPPPLEVSTPLIATLIGLEDYDTITRLCDGLLSVARRRLALQEAAAIAGFSAWAMHRRGELADAEARARWALERATGINAIHAFSQLVEALIDRDALAEAEEQLQRLPDPLESHSILTTNYLMARGRLRAAQGRAEDALRDFLDCGARSERLGALSALQNWRSQAALAHAALGRPEEARRLAAEEVEFAREFGAPGGLGIALRNQGLVEGGAPGLALLGEAVGVLERSQAAVELARAVTELGGALRRAGRRTEARTHLERGLDLAHHAGARRVTTRARSELVAAGARPRRDAITGRDALTAAELGVARLAAQGMTNREIAQALFITTKTASAHLSRVYRKLGITRREQLSDALAAGLRASKTAQTEAGLVVS
jgi:DNA-binding CsgD family transcriptional regulator